jgi:hypothetical protein
MASAGVTRSSLGFQNDTSSSSDADRLPNELGNMNIRDDKVIEFPQVVYKLLFGGLSVCSWSWLGNNAGH